MNTNKSWIVTRFSPDKPIKDQWRSIRYKTSIKSNAIEWAQEEHKWCVERNFVKKHQVIEIDLANLKYTEVVYEIEPDGTTREYNSRSGKWLINKGDNNG